MIVFDLANFLLEIHLEVARHSLDLVSKMSYISYLFDANPVTRITEPGL